MEGLTTAAKNFNLRPKVNILEDYEYGIIVKKYGHLPTTLGSQDYLKSRYYRLLALHFVVNIYV